MALSGGYCGSHSGVFLVPVAVFAACEKKLIRRAADTGNSSFRAVAATHIRQQPTSNHTRPHVQISGILSIYQIRAGLASIRRPRSCPLLGFSIQTQLQHPPPPAGPDQTLSHWIPRWT